MPILARVGRLFPRSLAQDTVQTSMHLRAEPEAVWNAMMFYEEVPGRPSALLRLFLPVPVSSSGEKTRVGATIECKYDGGDLVKHITAAERARYVGFDVDIQRLGIEDCISMTGGSYELRGDAGGTQVVLTTRYRGHLRPRWLWRPFERHLAHQVHRHILRGMRTALEGAHAVGGASALARS